MIILGIDPGAGGAIACWEKGITSHKCPKSTEEMSSLVQSYVGKNKAYAYIEQVHAMPHDGRSSLFKFGTNYGMWLGILAAHGIEVEKVSPQKWMKYWKVKLDIELSKDKPKRKRELKEIAQNYTDKTVTLYNADAILIAMYGLYTKQEENKNDSKGSKSKV
tara:strand:- start:4708 stop:5193 length:486 start_codon:yes stop_codon:yes gene_type:complete